MQYRPMTTQDIKTIFMLGKKDFGSHSEYSWDWSTAELQKYLKRSFGFGIVCSEKNSVVGFVLVQFFYSTQKSRTAWLTYIFVKKQHRGKHIASDLFLHARDKLKKHGKTELITDVYAKNTESLEFFRRKNFATKEYWYILAHKL